MDRYEYITRTCKRVDPMSVHIFWSIFHWSIKKSTFRQKRKVFFVFCDFQAWWHVQPLFDLLSILIVNKYSNNSFNNYPSILYSHTFLTNKNGNERSTNPTSMLKVSSNRFRNVPTNFRRTKWNNIIYIYMEALESTVVDQRRFRKSVIL